MRRLLGAALFLTLFAWGPARAAGATIPRAPVMWATDRAHLLSEPVRQDLDTRLYRHEQATGQQVLLYIADSTGDTPLEEWCVKAFEAWGVGKKGKDDGLVLFVFAGDRKLRIEVGYGLEDVVPDAVASRIIGGIITPKLRAGNSDEAITAGVEAILAVLDGKPLPGTAPVQEAAAPQAPSPPSPPVHLSFGQIVLLVLLGIGFLILLVTHPSLALWLLFQILSAAVSGGGGGGRGGGGWSGGGGRSGGGGASGSW